MSAAFYIVEVRKGRNYNSRAASTTWRRAVVMNNRAAADNRAAALAAKGYDVRIVQVTR